MQELKVIVLIACLFKFFSCQSIVETNSGYIKSVAAKLDDVEAFLGIPFAEPPIGDLRFAKPLPKQPWTKIYEASSLPPPCIQFSPADLEIGFLPDLSNMSEDCLYLNIWKPKAKPNGLLRPVIIYFYFGGFVTGASNLDLLDGSRLASQGDVVVVTLNYRLGSFGFFLANIEEADGNMGMYDQIMAIEWVKDNAQYFDGDPDNIILMGSSAGAISVSAHMISPLSQNLFKRAIIMSATIVNPIFLDGNEKLLKTSELVASIAGCTNETVTLKSDPRSVLKCLKGKPKEVVLEAQTRIAKTSPFYTRVGDQFLPEDAVSAFREGKFSRDIDVMFGSDKDEGTIFILAGLMDYLGKYGTNPITMSRSRASGIMRVLLSTLKVKNSSEKINYYLERVKSPTSTEYLKAISDMTGDVIVSCSLVFMADFLSLKGNRVYFYKFGHRTAASPMADWLGTLHCEDIQYVFGNILMGNFTAEELDLSNRIIARFSAFAYTGNPNLPGELPWLQYNYNEPLYLNIGQDEESIQLKPWHRCEDWRNVFNTEIDFDDLNTIESTSDLKTRSEMNSANGTRSYVTILIMMFMIFCYVTLFIAT